MMRVLDISGFRINPSNLYHATPWTWAIDWVTDLGGHIDRLDQIYLDNVACKYCYAMQRQIKMRTFYVVIPWLDGDVNLSFSRLIETKQRDEASSPYGFGLDWSQLTPMQMAIAGALGISRRG
jgi:hypothetical protein